MVGRHSELTKKLKQRFPESPRLRKLCISENLVVEIPGIFQKNTLFKIRIPLSVRN
jgi:hypothetical protein